MSHRFGCSGWKRVLSSVSGSGRARALRLVRLVYLLQTSAAHAAQALHKVIYKAADPCGRVCPADKHRVDLLDITRIELL